MADFISPSAPSLDVKPSASAAFSSGDVDETFEDDSCSICLEPFSTVDPATVTSCRHEYHLQCILEWSQRSKECPICWQNLALKDPASQELLAAVENERHLRASNISTGASTNRRYLHENNEEISFRDDSDFKERMMQRFAAAASRARHFRRRERQRSPGLGPSQVLVSPDPSNDPCIREVYSSSSEDGSSESDSPWSGTISVQDPSLVPSPTNEGSATALDCEGPHNSGVLFGQSASGSHRRAGPSDLVSLSDSIKSKLSAASARYKDSISRSTRGFKEKLLARNNSVKELSKGVQRDMSAGIAGFARMFERLDLTPKQNERSVSDSDCTSGTSDIPFKGKALQEAIRSVGKSSRESAHDMGLGAPSCISSAVPGQVEVSHVQGPR